MWDFLNMLDNSTTILDILDIRITIYLDIGLRLSDARCDTMKTK